MTTQNNTKMLNGVKAMCLGTTVCGLLAWQCNPFYQTIIIIISIIMAVISVTTLRKGGTTETIERRMTYIVVITITITIIIELCLIVQSKEYHFLEYTTLMFLVVQSGSVLSTKITNCKIDIIAWVLLIIAVVCAIFT